jgi:pimeloyl-ACP methyl ester carboxylesterase
MGGHSALLYAVTKPTRIDRVILVGEPPGSTRKLGLKIRAIGTPVISRLLLATLGRPGPAPSFLRRLGR